MNPFRQIAAVFSFVLCVFAMPFAANAQIPLLEVSPDAHDFGNVVIGDSSLMEFTITNIDGRPVRVDSVTIVDDASGSFVIVSAAPPPTVILDEFSGKSLNVSVEFSPTSTGMLSASLRVQSDDTPPYNDRLVPLQGIGVSVSAIEEILDFFDDSVASEDLVGVGPGDSANGRLNALRNMFEMAGDLISIGDIEGACIQLDAALGKCDGDILPPDFVSGNAVLQLSSMIVGLTEELGCE